MGLIQGVDQRIWKGDQNNIPVKIYAGFFYFRAPYYINFLIMRKSIASLFLLLSFVSTGQVQLVTNLNDNGAGSLRSAIAAASSGDTVQFDTSLFLSGNDTLFLSSELLIDESLVIRGSIKNGDTIFISGDQSTRVFKVDFQNPPTGMVIFEDLAIVKGSFSQAPGGGGIYSEFVDTLIVKNCYFKANRTSFNGEGGAIRSWWSNTFVYDCTFIDNTASGSSYTTGGAISALYCDVHTERSVYKKNMASGGGGAIYVENGGCVARSSLFEGNYTTLLFTSPGGGACYISGIEPVEFTDCLFDDNYSGAQGGAIKCGNWHQGMKMTFQRCHFKNNGALNEGAAGDFSRGNPFLMEYCTFENNYIVNTYEFHGTLELDNCNGPIARSTFYNTEAPILSGGNYQGGQLEVLNSTLVNADNTTHKLIASFSTSNFKITGSIIATNGSKDVFDPYDNYITSGGHNLISTYFAYGLSSDSTDVSWSQLQLDSILTSVEGSLPVLLPFANSPAVNAGDSLDFTPAQNGKIFGIREIGAAEYGIYQYDTAEACDQYVYRDSTFYNSGDYRFERFNSIGTLDTVWKLHLDITTIDTTIWLNSGLLHSGESDSLANYQWVNCDSTFLPIPGATSGSYAPSVNGSYAVMVSLNGCQDTSVCYRLDNLDTEELNVAGRFAIYPNPSSDKVHVQLSGSEPLKVRIINSQGLLVYEGVALDPRVFEFSVSDWPAGFYVLQLTGSGISKVKTFMVHHNQ